MHYMTIQVSQGYNDYILKTLYYYSIIQRATSEARLYVRLCQV